jgi:hypothetical protein
MDVIFYIATSVLCKALVWCVVGVILITAEDLCIIGITGLSRSFRWL